MKLSLCIIATALSIFDSRADTTVTAPAPGGPGTDAASFAPFLIQQLAQSSMRYQQVYGASSFSALDPGGEQITRLTFYVDDSLQTNSIYSWGLENFQINLSTTTAAVDSLSPVFAMNVGPNDQVVFGPGQHDFIAFGAGKPVTITLPQPFFYNPALGNLLLDVRVFVAGGMPDINNPSLDAQLTPLDTVSRLFATDVTALSGTLDSGGLRTLFTTKSVPEPSCICFFLLSGIGLLTLARQRKMSF